MPIIKLLASTIISFYAFTAAAQAKDSLDVVETTQKFITSFNNFDWTTFKQSFVRDATLFFPELQYGKRVEGIKAVESAWLEIFPEFKDSANKLTMKIEPVDMRVQLYGSTAIVSFHLGKSDRFISRRTLVLIRQKNSWKIAHLHASNFSAN